MEAENRIVLDSITDLKKITCERFNLPDQAVIGVAAIKFFPALACHEFDKI